MKTKNIDALNNIKSFVDYFINEDGTLRNGATWSGQSDLYMGFVVRLALLLHKEIGSNKYQIFARNAKAEIVLSANTLPSKDGMYGIDMMPITEVLYHGLCFFASYGDYFNATDMTNLAATECIKQYNYFSNNGTLVIPRSFSDVITSVGWARGMGWLYKGIARLLIIPSIKNHPQYSEIVDIYVKLTNAFVAYVREDGLFESRLNLPYELFGETTGTSLLVGAIKVGIDEGILGSTYQEVVLKGIKAVMDNSYLGISLKNVFLFNGNLGAGDYTGHNYAVPNNSDIGWGLMMEAVSEIFF